MIISGGLYKKSDFLLDNLTKECYNITCNKMNTVLIKSG